MEHIEPRDHVRGWELAAEQELRRALTRGFTESEMKRELANVAGLRRQAADQADTRRSEGLASVIVSTIDEQGFITTPAWRLADCASAASVAGSTPTTGPSAPGRATLKAPLSASSAMVAFTNDADMVLFHVPAPGRAAASDAEITELSGRLEAHVGRRLEAAHGDEVAALFDIYVGVAHVYYNPKVRLERLIYRGIREAAVAAKSVEQRERLLHASP